MNRVITHIEHLVRCRDCVIVPRLGGFVVQQIPAYYDESSSRYYPPRKYVIFNPELSHNDGLLATSISRRENVSYECASRMIEEEVDAMVAQLKVEGSIALGHLGRLDYEEGKMLFAYSEAFVSSPEYFGLKPLDVRRIDIEEAHTETESVKKPFLLRRKLMYVALAAVSIVVLILCGLLFTTPIPVDNDVVQRASLSLPDVKAREVENKATEVLGELYIACPNPEDGYAIAKERHHSAMIDDSDPYYLVVSALATRQQAEEFVAYSRGCELEIVETANGKYSVIAATGESVADVMRKKHDSNVNSLYPDAWPCKR